MTTRALVLGGGGIAGIGWEIGVIAGLASHGVDLRDADLLVGTSAGSVVAALLGRGDDPKSLYESQLQPPDGEVAAEMDLKAVGTAFVEATVGEPTSQEMLARLGASALAAGTASESSRQSIIQSRLGDISWPETPLLVTAVDATSGEFRAFRRSDGEDLVDVVTASCAVPMVWPPASFGGRRWMDGGVRSLTNADLAEGHDVVLVVAPMLVPAGSPFGAGLEDEEQHLVDGGSRVLVVAGDRASAEAAGNNSLDPATRAPSARAGFARGTAIAADVQELWSSPA